MGLLRTLVGIITELTNQPDPYDKPIIASAHIGMKRGRKVINVTANNYLEAAKYAEGITPAGDVHIAINHIGHNKWQIAIEDNEIDF